MFQTRDGLVLVVADGAGGTGGGELAADEVIRSVGAALLNDEPHDWVEILDRVDRRLLDAGWTTAVVIEVVGDRIAGASVGDSRAWLYCDGRCDELTKRQERKPLLGSGRAQPVPFTATLRATDLLFMATDGICDYLPMADVGRLTMNGSTLGELVEAFMLPKGGLPDDVAVIRCCLVDPAAR